MRVTLINYTPDPERLVALAGRTCYTSKDFERLNQGLELSEIERMVDLLTVVGHTSTVEHVSFTFAIDGVSRALSHQLVRHRIASYSQRSQRYVDESGFNYVTPPSIARNEEANRVYKEKMEEIARAYRELAEMVPREDARYILPNACTTQLICTFNARSLHNFFALRLCRRAQWEIREMAGLMLEEVRKVAPHLFKVAGPTCETQGICWEGDKSCGACEDIRTRS